jgi:hormone-sensitive lipase
VCIVGDSAGANLAVAVSLKAIVSGIRQPDGILSVYGCLLVKYTPSPSRILALMDPLLPIGVLSLCLHGKCVYFVVQIAAYRSVLCRCVQCRRV